MSKNREIRRFTLDEHNLNGGRNLLAEWEWGLIKDAIDATRENPQDEDYKAILVGYNLWDAFHDRPNEEAIDNLYMEYT